ncbi:radical SAM/SPASM domain-containing protein [Helicobacter sp.]|uniref:radical SAM/SPASM domain-containing protein n=1 Tax=Helicobacter sp. TaxID=218 RepID=UPI002A752726|nr:SPASM domain-containing protein [Helicobacter sp.]MDY2585306.1 SPASM domain-containing protein [Helicobacter sp.]
MRSGGGGIYSSWIEKITLTRDGEPLLDKKIAQRIADLKRVGIQKVVIVTNAQLLTLKKAQEILSSGIDEIMFSVDGYSKEVYEKIRVGLQRDLVYNNVLNFISLRNAYFPKVCIKVRFIEQELNKMESQIWLDFWKSKLQATDVAYIMPLHSWGNQLEKEKQEKVKALSSYACISPFSSLAMHYDGRVGLCGVDYGCKFLLGDFRDSSIQEIWQGERARAVKEAHLSGNRNAYSLCQGCDLWDRTYKY